VAAAKFDHAHAGPEQLECKVFQAMNPEDSVVLFDRDRSGDLFNLRRTLSLLTGDERGVEQLSDRSRGRYSLFCTIKAIQERLRSVQGSDFTCIDILDNEGLIETMGHLLQLCQELGIMDISVHRTSGTEADAILAQIELKQREAGSAYVKAIAGGAAND
jgi:hypothetical protein